MYLTCQRTENVRVVRRKGQRGTKGGEVILCRILKTILRSLPFILRWEIMKGFEQKRVMINLCFNIIILAFMLNIYTGGNGGMMETSYKIFTLIQERKIVVWTTVLAVDMRTVFWFWIYFRQTDRICWQTKYMLWKKREANVLAWKTRMELPFTEMKKTWWGGRLFEVEKYQELSFQLF